MFCFLWFVVLLLVVVVGGIEERERRATCYLVDRQGFLFSSLLSLSADHGHEMSPLNCFFFCLLVFSFSSSSSSSFPAFLANCSPAYAIYHDPQSSTLPFCVFILLCSLPFSFSLLLAALPPPPPLSLLADCSAEQHPALIHRQGLLFSSLPVSQWFSILYDACLFVSRLFLLVPSFFFFLVPSFCSFPLLFLSILGQLHCSICDLSWSSIPCIASVCSFFFALLLVPSLFLLLLLFLLPQHYWPTAVQRMRSIMVLKASKPLLRSV